MGSGQRHLEKKKHLLYFSYISIFKCFLVFHFNIDIWRSTNTQQHPVLDEVRGHRSNDKSVRVNKISISKGEKNFKYKCKLIPCDLIQDIGRWLLVDRRLKMIIKIIRYHRHLIVIR